MNETDVKPAILAVVRERGPIGWYGIEIHLPVPRHVFKDGYTLMTYLEEMVTSGSIERIAAADGERFVVAKHPWGSASG
jgi:hypothetical protein